MGAQNESTGLFFCRGGTTIAGFGYCNSAPNTLGYNWNNDYFSYEWDSGITPPANVWSLVTYVATPTNVTVYLVNASGTVSAFNSGSNPNEAFDWPSTIGSDAFTNIRTFDGLIADVALFNQALSQSQIVDLYNAGANGVAAPPPPSPTLQISLVSPTNVLLIWPAFATNFGLQGNFDLSTTNWSFLTNLVVTNGNQIQVVLPTGPNSQFYRLSTQ